MLVVGRQILRRDPQGILGRMYSDVCGHAEVARLERTRKEVILKCSVAGQRSVLREKLDIQPDLFEVLRQDIQEGTPEGEIVPCQR